MYNNFEVFDLCESQNAGLKKKWSQDFPELISKENHKLKSNYLNITELVDKHLSFLLVVEKSTGDFVMFEGLWNAGSYPGNIARVLNRKYIYPKYRESISANVKHNFSLSKNLTMPIFFEKAKKLKLDAIFISREGKYNRSFKLLIDSLNDGSAWQFKVLDELANVCRQHNDSGAYIGINSDESCWQLVAIHSFSDTYNFNLPKKLVNA